MGTHYVCISLDFDTVSLWQAMGQTGPSAISRGEFGVVAAQRLLRLFSETEIATTWFIPGMTIDTYPDVCETVAEQGHENRSTTAIIMWLPLSLTERRSSSSLIWVLPASKESVDKRPEGIALLHGS